MSPQPRDIARYLSMLTRTAAKYQLARTQEFTAKPVAVEFAVKGGVWSSRVAAYRLAVAALGDGRAWGKWL